MSRRWDQFANWSAGLVGSARAFLLACAVVVVWAALGWPTHFSNTWQLIINTLTTISTGLIVFLIQHQQLSDTRALHAKLDTLIAALPEAKDELRGMERRSSNEQEELRERAERD